MQNPTDIKSLTREELEACLVSWGEPRYRAGQVVHWLYPRHASGWDAMTNLPQTLRRRLAEHFTFNVAELLRLQGARDTTQKFLWRLRDHSLVESVLIPANPALYGDPSDRHTLCISTQVGCAYGCRFCASGLAGWKRNLTPDEIVEQVLAVERWHAASPPQGSSAASLPTPAAAAESTADEPSPAQSFHTSSAGSGDPAYKAEASQTVGRVPPRGAASPSQAACEVSGLDHPGGALDGEDAAARATAAKPCRLVSNIVVMGMGEPLANYDHLLRALRILNAPWGGGIGARKITVSTSGLAPEIRKLAGEPMQLRLAISLHAGTNAVRDRLMPVNHKYPLEQLIAACEYYQARKGRMITFEYILIAGVNESLSEARTVAVLARRLHAKINLIPYNHVEGLPWERPPVPAQEAFLAELTRLGVGATLRTEKGHDIDAACGQLRLKTEREMAVAPVAREAGV